MIVAFLAGLFWALRRPRELPVGPETPAPGPAPETTRPEPPVTDPEPTPWVDSLADGSCPISHPVKLKVSSGIYHVEGQRNYERTNADRCYRNPADAEADGHRPSKI